MKYTVRSLLDAADPAEPQDNWLARMAPFGVLLMLAFALAPASGATRDPAALLAAGALVAVITATAVLVRSQRVGPTVRFGCALGSLAVLALLRQAEPVGAPAVGVLALVPVVWAALYGSPRQLRISVVAVAATFIAPIFAVGAPRYPAVEWARAALWALGALTIGSTIQRLVMTVRRQAHALERLALTDSLTSLPNLRGWDDALRRELARARRSGAPLALAMIDLDHLKRVNDHGGHQAGSRAIKSAAAAWSGRLRASDTLARFGGDEFGLVLPETEARAAAAVADRLRRATPTPLTCSIGVTAWDGVESADDLFIRADRALYEAKARGRDCVVLETVGTETSAGVARSARALRGAAGS